jgi:lipid-binding SYLF domain-containing protein
MTNTRRTLQNLLFVAVATFSLGAISSHAVAATAEDLNKDAAQALQTLYKTNPVAEDLSKKAKEGVAKNLSSSTLKKDAYAFIFDQQGLMASLSIEGTKISRIKR